MPRSKDFASGLGGAYPNLSDYLLSPARISGSSLHILATVGLLAAGAPILWLIFRALGKNPCAIGYLVAYMLPVFLYFAFFFFGPMFNEGPDTGPVPLVFLALVVFWPVAGGLCGWTGGTIIYIVAWLHAACTWEHCRREGERRLRELSAADCEEADVVGERAVILAKVFGEDEEARTLFDKLAEAEGGSPELLVAAGRTMESFDAYDSAICFYLRAVNASTDATQIEWLGKRIAFARKRAGVV